MLSVVGGVARLPVGYWFLWGYMGPVHDDSVIYLEAVPFQPCFMGIY